MAGRGRSCSLAHDDRECADLVELTRCPDDLDAVAIVRRSAEVTLGARGARIGQRILMPRDPARGDNSDLTGEGIADLAGMRCDFRTQVPASVPRAMSHFARRVSENHPWVLREDELAGLESAELKDMKTHNVFVGGAKFTFHPYLTDVCFYSTGDPTSHRRASEDPTWIIEALLHVDEADLRGSEQVRETVCRRLGFHVDLERHRGDLERPSGLASLGAPHLVGEVWIDEAELVGRVSREEIDRRSGRSSRSDNLVDRVGRKTITELWDYGIEVSIPYRRCNTLRPGPSMC